MTRKEEYVTLCEKMDDILIDSGIRAICIECFTEGIEERRKRGMDQLGCCGGCEYLGKKGCTSISLGCKVWFCSIMKQKFETMLEEKGHLERFKEIKNKSYRFPDFRSGNGCRVTVNELFGR
jgi:hypothetical protein